MPHDPATIRQRMGDAFAGIAPYPGTVTRHADSWWALLSELPVPDANMVLVHENDPAAADEALAMIAARNVPALFMLAGDGERLGAGLGAAWSHVGAMPLMTKDLVGSQPEEDDPRVRAATSDDVATCSRLMERAFGLPPEATDLFAACLVPAEGGTFWILEDAGEAVSAVFTHRSGDSVSVWCMSTPPDQQRRGYGRALLSTALARAVADGATWGVLGATEAGFPLYDATGWTAEDEWQIYVNADSAQFG